MPTYSIQIYQTVETETIILVQASSEDEAKEKARRWVDNHEPEEILGCGDPEFVEVEEVEDRESVNVHISYDQDGGE